MIPKTFWTYWSGGMGPSWLRLQTIETFRRHNPDWAAVSIHERPDGFVSSDSSQMPWIPRNLPASMPPDARCDVVRWCTLAAVGGVFSDLDVLYLRPIPWDPKTLAVTCDGGTPEILGRSRSFAIGLVLAPAGDPLVAKIAQKALARSAAWKEGTDHQHCGSRLLSEEAKAAENSAGLRIENIPAAALYPQGFHRRDNEKIWLGSRASEVSLDGLVGLHWGGGHSASRVAEEVVDERWVRQSGCMTAQAWRMAMGIKT